MKNSLIKTSGLVSAAMVAALGISHAANAEPASSLFSMTDLNNGYMVALAEGKCGEGKCGGDAKEKDAEGKCGEGKCGADAKEKDAEGKCGEGKCGGDAKEKDAEGKCGEGKCGGLA
ncbi:MAG: hypothetical protein ACNA8G_05065 [Gammaproteobacteria bacterium]